MENLEFFGENQGPLAVDNLYPALTQCFAVILCGYLAGRMNWITETEAKGMNVFVGTFSLPALIFMSLVKLNLNAVNWTFLLAILLSKSVVFSVVIAVAALVTRPLNMGRAGIFAIFCTQSNDFAIGYPLVEAVYTSTHPDYVSYLYLVAPINLAILNPLAFILLELERRKSITSPTTLSMTSSSTATTRFKSFFGVLKNIFLNPIVSMTLLGVAANVTMHRDVPAYLANFLETLGSAFSASALFLLGVRMVGKVHTLKGATLMIPGILIMVKLIVLPLVTREVVSLLNAGTNATDTADLSTFGFLYGTFPSAPAVFVFATQYAVEVDLIASSMVACTFLSAPLMFISAKMIEFSGGTPSTDFRRELDTFSMNLGLAGGVACLWCFVVFGIAGKWKKTPHNITLYMLISQFMACVGVVMWYVTVTSGDVSPPSWTHYVIFSIFAAGVYGARIWTAILSVTLLFLQCRGLCYVTKLMPLFLFLGFGFPVVLSGALVAFGGRSMASSDDENLNFLYGKLEAVVSVTLLVLCFIVTCGCLILHQRYHRKFQGYRDIVREVNDRLEPGTSNGSIVNNDTNGKILATIEENNPTTPEIEDLFSTRKTSSSYLICRSESFGCGSSSGKTKMAAQCRKLQRHVQEQDEHDGENVEGHEDEEDEKEFEEEEEEEEFENGHDPQIVRHIVLLLLLLCSMFVGLALCVWTLMSRRLLHSPSASSSPVPTPAPPPTTGAIYVELSFLDAALNFGQSVVTLAVFCVSGVATPRLVKLWRRLWYGDADLLILPNITDLSDEAKKTCETFRKYHEANCRRDIARNRRWRIKIYPNSFPGHLLVDWLINVGLAGGRGEATAYARHLVNGRVISHINRVYHFYDGNLLYRLVSNGDTKTDD